MKKRRFLLAFMLSLCLVLITSCCGDEDYPKPETNKFIIEPIEQSWLVLKPTAITKDVYKNNKNIFLNVTKTNNDGSIVGNWYTKKDNLYQIFSLNYQGFSKINQELAYEISDTINVDLNFYKSQNFYNPLFNGYKILASAYQSNKAELIYVKTKKTYLAKYLWTKVMVRSQDSLIKYQTDSKSFVVFIGKPETKIKTDVLPLIFIIILFILSLKIATRKKIDLVDGVSRIIKKNRLILFWLLCITNSVYIIIWIEFVLQGSVIFFVCAASAVIAYVTGWAMSSLNNLISSNKNIYKQEVNKIINIAFISLVCGLNLLFLTSNPQLALTGFLTTFTSTIIVFFQLVKIKQSTKR